MNIKGLAILFLLGAIALVVWSMADWSTYWKARKWPAVEILEFEALRVQGGVLGDASRVNYVYEFEGAIYQATNVFENWNPNVHTTAHVNPDKPSDSFIPTGFPKNSIVLAGCGVGLFILGIYMWKNAEDWK
jgi:hypothetical protein